MIRMAVVFLDWVAGAGSKKGVASATPFRFAIGNSIDPGGLFLAGVLLSQFDLDLVVIAIIDQADEVLALLNSIELQALDRRADPLTRATN